MRLRRIALVVEYPGEYVIVDRDSDTEYGPFTGNIDPEVVARNISAQLSCPVLIESKRNSVTED
jgi:hypothetical protein